MVEVVISARKKVVVFAKSWTQYAHRLAVLVGYSATTPVRLVGSSDLQRVCDLQHVFYIALPH